jgi:hypothetical protein
MMAQIKGHCIYDWVTAFLTIYGYLPRFVSRHASRNRILRGTDYAPDAFSRSMVRG